MQGVRPSTQALSYSHTAIAGNEVHGLRGATRCRIAGSQIHWRACHLHMTPRNSLSLCLVVLVACTNGDPPSENEHVAGWANASSALGVFSVGHEPIGFADGQAPVADPACPVTTDNGTTVTIQGGCMNSKGVTWAGTAT